jgi:hypothetical protein
VEARAVRSGELVARASGRSCRVPASTPLAALLAVLERKRVDHRLRDFGRCERRRGASSAQLFVERIAADRNRGQDGWVYKVNDYARSTGAADVTAPRLRTGDRVLWLFCRLDAATRSCQRSLRVLPAQKSAPPGTGLRVQVRAYDNERRAVPAAGARVSLGPATAVTGSTGAALLATPAPGTYPLAASAPGAIDSFPIPFRVR